MSPITGGITKFSKIENLEKILKVELLLLEYLATENPKEIEIPLRFSLWKNCVRMQRKCYKNISKKGIIFSIFIGFSVLKKSENFLIIFLVKP